MIPPNLLLWGSENWSLRQDLLRKLEVFLHQSVRRILRIFIIDMREIHKTYLLFVNAPMSLTRIAKLTKKLFSSYGLHTTETMDSLGKQWCSGSGVGAAYYVHGISNPAGVLCELMVSIIFGRQLTQTWFHPVWNTFLLGFDIFCKKLYFNPFLPSMR